MTAVHLAILVLCVATMAAFGVAAGVWFVSIGRDPPGLNAVKIIGPATYAAVLVAMVCGDVAGPRAWIGGALMLLALAWFAWALRSHRGRRLSRVYCTDEPLFLTARGPYRFVRHPCYAAYLVAFVGAVVASGALWLAAVVLVNLGLYVHAARHEERKFLASPLADEYAAYRRRTGMLCVNPIKWLRRDATDA